MNLVRGLTLSAVVLAAAVLWYLYQPAPIDRKFGAASTPNSSVESSSVRPPAESIRPNSPEPPPAPGTRSSTAKAATIAPRKAAEAARPAIVAAPSAGQPRPSSVPEAEAIRSDLDGVSNMMRDYRSRFGGNPVGNNAEIMQAIMGGNKKGARLGPPEGQQLNAQGELVDRWGTPYFFHQLSGIDMEIRSAGPDRTMWTGDDQIVKSTAGTRRPVPP